MGMKVFWHLVLHRAPSYFGGKFHGKFSSCLFVLEKYGKNKDNSYVLNEGCKGCVFLASGKFKPAANAKNLMTIKELSVCGTFIYG